MNIDEGRKFAVITGGSSGIGYEFAKVCAEQNLEVFIVADYGRTKRRSGSGPVARRSLRSKQTCPRSTAMKESPRRSCSAASRWTCWR
jgi:NAD(P)-dependent dehydrogenase (short-subunit alcohol dehydrogenase family)